MGKPKKRRRKPPRPVVATPFSENRKTGPIAVTYVAQGSCPLTCPFLDCGCYGEEGPIGIITRRLNKAAVGMTPEELAEAEAELILSMPARSDMRLHGVGDCRTNESAQIVAAASYDYLARCRFQFKVFGYTHAWMIVDRDSWGVVSMLASVETLAAAASAMSRGYAAAIVLEDFETDDGRSYGVLLPDGPATLVPCLYQTREIQCIDCRLCMDADKLCRERRVIGFKAHGARRSSVIQSLEVIQCE